MKRILSLILALMLALSCLPLDTRAFSAELEPEIVAGEEAEPEPVAGEEAEPEEDNEEEGEVQKSELPPDDTPGPVQESEEETVTEAVQYNGPDGDDGNDGSPSEPLEPPQAHEHDYTAGWVYFQSSTDPEAAGYANSGDITWNPEVSHGRVAKCMCGETNHAYNIWMEPHSLDENGRCTKCNWERQYTVLVQYTVPANDTPPASQTATGVPGAEYSIRSPQVEGLLPSRETVSGTFSEGDETITVAYTEVSSTVTVNYTVPEGFNAPDPKSVTNTYHSDYSIPSPVLEGLTADRGDVSGQIQAQDETFTVSYTENDHTLTVVYKVPDGSDAPDPVMVRGKHGGKYNIKSPTLLGLTPDRAEVVGEMGITDETITVTYSPHAPHGAGEI